MFRVIDAEHPPIRARGTGAHARKSWLVAKQADLKPVQRLQQLQLLQRPRRQLLQQQKQLQKQQLQQDQSAEDEAEMEIVIMSPTHGTHRLSRHDTRILVLRTRELKSLRDVS